MSKYYTTILTYLYIKTLYVFFLYAFEKRRKKSVKST